MLLRTRRDLTMAEAARGPGNARVDHLVVADMIEPRSRVLDVGCGDGELLKLLESRGVDGRGIELSREGVNECVAKGLAVIQGAADSDWQTHGFGAHVMVMGLDSSAQVVGVEFRRCGQRRAMGRYPMHWHMLSYTAANAS